ncbi:MAG: hypothetical protein ACHQUC_01440 [Chlamydiales bacterium]
MKKRLNIAWMGIAYISIVVVTYLTMVGCAVQPVKVVPTAPPPEVNLTVRSYPTFSWDKDPSRVPWGHFLYDKISDELMPSFDKALDAGRFCPKYASLIQDQRAQMWVEMFIGMMLYESSWKPTSRMVETTMSIDPVTGHQVASEGLLQLSYQDVPNYAESLIPGFKQKCGIDWSKDSGLATTDPRKTIFDPYINMTCGSLIMANQIDRKGYVILSSGVYWAVLRDGGKYRMIKEITDRTKALSFCQ